MLFYGYESMRLRRGELLAQSLCEIKRHGIGGIMLKDFIKLHESFGIFSFIFQGHAQIQSCFGQIRHDTHCLAKLFGRFGWLAIAPKFHAVEKMRLHKSGDNLIASV